MSDKDQIKSALNNKFSNPTLLEYDVEKQIVLIKNMDEYVIYNFIKQNDEIFFQNGNYFENIREAVDRYESKVLVKKEDPISILTKEIENIEKNIASLETSFESIEKVIETFSPNLFGENGYLEEYKTLEGTEKEEFAEKINNLLNINLDDMQSSMELINKALIVKDETLVKLKDFEKHLEVAKNEYQKISFITTKNESLFAKDELLSLINKENQKNMNLQERI